MMKKIFISITKTLFYSLIISVLFSSCVSQEKILYLQNAQMFGDTSINYVNQRHFDYTVQPGDNLFIRVISGDESASKLFNSGSGSALGYTTGTTFSSGNAMIYLNGYTVSDEGFIDFPLAGKVYVKTLNIEQIKDTIQGIIDVYLKETTVFVKLGLFNLTIIGEVNRPGQYQVYQSDIDLFQAIALAGNLTDFAKKSDVKIVRQTVNGSKIIKVNLNNADILSSPNFYLRPNDIIYVEPLKIKQFGFTTFPYSTLISLTTLGITIYTLLVSGK